MRHNIATHLEERSSDEEPRLLKHIQNHNDQIPQAHRLRRRLGVT